jgi:hypothetical protein
MTLGQSSTGSRSTAVPIAPPGATAASCPTTAHVSAERAALPKLSYSAASSLKKYSQDAPANANALRWYDSGGRFGGGVPAGAVRSLMRKGLASGLTDGQVASFLNPGFLRAVSDPYGGGAILSFIADRNDPTFFQQLAAYAGSASSPAGTPMQAQRALLQAFPLLDVVYEAQAGIPPLDETAAAAMVDLAGSGYRPALRTIDRILAAGNHPRAGAQDSGSVADHVLPAVYDFFVANYQGPLSEGARVAVANRIAYLGWVDRIATWTGTGSKVEGIPAPATFTASQTIVSPAPAGTDTSCGP